VRDQKIKAITNQYYTMLTDYIQSYNYYLNGQNGITESILKTKNDQLLSVASQLQKNNDQVKNDAATMFNNYKLDSSLYTASSDIKQLGNDLQVRQQEISSSQQLASQMQQLTRYQNKIFWIRLVLFLVLLVGIVYIGYSIHTKNPEFWLFKDMSQAAKNAADATRTAAQGAYESATKVVVEVKSAGGKLTKRR